MRLNNLLYIPKIWLKLLHLFFAKRKIVLVQTPLHNNIGDQAITLAEYKFLNDNFHKTKIIEVPAKYLQPKIMSLLKICIKKDDLILIHGGGFLGTLWMNEENTLLMVLNTFYDRHIIIMPQTVYYENDSAGTAELEKSKQFYGRCKKLLVFLREKYSYDYFKQNFEGIKTFLVPDIVLYFDKYKTQHNIRKNILLCFRNDLEKTQDVSKYIKQKLSYLNETFLATDMTVNHLVLPHKRTKEVSKKLNEFGNSRLVITDRLHGMIFAAITETPCIVILSKSHKVKGVYQWIKHLDYIKLIENISEIKSAADKILGICPSYDNVELKGEFETLKNEILKWNK